MKQGERDAEGLNPLLTSDLLQILRAMGHGDELVLCDSNFPADQVARSTVTGVFVLLDGADVRQAADAILSVFPLDSFVEYPVYRMEVVGDPTTVTPVQQDFKEMVDKHGDRDARWDRSSGSTSTTGPEGLCRGFDHGAAPLRLFHPGEGRDRAGRKRGVIRGS